MFLTIANIIMYVTKKCYIKNIIQKYGAKLIQEYNRNIILNW